MGMSAHNGDDDNTSIVKPKERFALKGEQERGRKLFFWNQFKVFEFRNLKKKNKHLCSKFDHQFIIVFRGSITTLASKNFPYFIFWIILDEIQ